MARGVRQLVALAPVADGEAFGALKLTPSSRAVLKGETSVMLREQTAQPARAKPAKKRGQGDRRRPHSALLEALRAWRLGVAASTACRVRGVHDGTLETIAALRPGTREALRACPGGREETRALRRGLARSRRSHSV